MKKAMCKKTRKKDHYEELKIAIILQAVEDYRYLLSNNLNSAIKYHSKLSIDELHNFFLSDWFKCLTNVDGKRLINQIRKEFKLKPITDWNTHSRSKNK